MKKKKLHQFQALEELNLVQVAKIGNIASINCFKKRWVFHLHSTKKLKNIDLSRNQNKVQKHTIITRSKDQPTLDLRVRAEAQIDQPYLKKNMSQ